jgi:hypothetical protein
MDPACIGEVTREFRAEMMQRRRAWYFMALKAYCRAKP